MLLKLQMNYGYRPIGGSDYYGINYLYSNPVTVTVPTLITKAYYYSGIVQNVKIGVYSDSSGKPGTKLFETALEACAALALHEFTFPTPYYLACITIHIVVTFSVQAAGNIYVNNGGLGRYMDHTYDGTLPTTWSDSGAHNVRRNAYISGVAFVGDKLFHAVLLQNFQGLQGSSIFVDDSQYNRALTPVGSSMKTDTTHIKYGISSGAGFGRVDADDSDDFYIAAGDFTLIMDFYFETLPTVSQCVLTQYVQDGTCYSWQFEPDGAQQRFLYGGHYAFSILFDWYVNISITTGQWYHAELTRSGNTFRLFLDGALIATIEDTVVFPNYASVFHIGALGNYSPFVGWLGQVIFIKGTALHTTAYTPPTAPLTIAPTLTKIMGTSNANILKVLGI